jgi:folate-dependent phosphoribosylglycinamide formyltransferase PurN
MTQLVYDPAESGERMKIVCFVSGSGTNYREIVRSNSAHDYIVFTNRPDCGGAKIAGENKHRVLELSHIPYLREARKKYGPGKVPRNAPERIQYEKDLCWMIEEEIGRKPDLICLAGYDQLNTDFMVDRYYPRMVNVHPGDTIKGYAGLGWIGSAMAILAGEESIRSTLFIVDKNMDAGPILVQSEPLKILETLENAENSEELVTNFRRIMSFTKASGINTYEGFRSKADEGLVETMKSICSYLQEVLKERGDWKIYPFAVHELIARGRVQVIGRTVYIDGKQMPEYGYRMEEKIRRVKRCRK